MLLRILSTLLLLALPAFGAIQVSRPSPASVIAPGQKVLIFVTTTPPTTEADVFTFCLIGDANNNNARVGGCGGISPAGTFTVADLRSGRVTADVPGNLPPGSYRVIIGNAARNCQAVNCATDLALGQPFTINAPPPVAGPASDPALDPRGFGLTIEVPSQIAANQETPIRAVTDVRFSEAVQFNQCTLFSATGDSLGTCLLPEGTRDISITALRAGQIRVRPPAGFLGAAHVEMSVSSAGCRVDNDCFSDKVSSKNLQVVERVAQPPPPPAPPAPTRPPASPPATPFPPIPGTATTAVETASTIASSPEPTTVVTPPADTPPADTPAGTGGTVTVDPQPAPSTGPNPADASGSITVRATTGVLMAGICAVLLSALV
ncbi:hypothetical protein BC832DRAFT_568001 [Gaertneriomyces semiglobifer]|nr:hypothetical protein BC832DRAFT_568001 [Gaertneriomyces semiglobifer]